MRQERGDIYVGIDVAKGRLDVSVRPTLEQWTAGNDKKGIRDLIRKLKVMEPALVVLEATGGMERAVVTALATAEVAVAVANPRQVRNFAKAVGRLAKTDAIDAAVLAHFAEAVKPEARPLKASELQELGALITRRSQILQMLGAERNRLAQASPDVHSDIKAHIRWLKRRLNEMDKALRKALREHTELKDKDEILRSVPGVGPVLSMMLLAEVPELGELTRREVASLIGVAPLNRDSGQYRGRRRIWGGRAKVRSVLYMATVTAKTYNPAIRSFYRHLIEQGKKPKVALTACMRKMLVILNAMMKKRELWRQEPHFSLDF